ncbi:sulfite exporter TauE/SafE family protein [Sporosarcina sp. FSL W7-1349]|uniref:sulfite exporter TauE/SafE family protein n=1 Tax=Sporosarcina sp. FSL W7-1349 TaxID=2921561 RepID=UPI0030FC1A45
MGEWTILIVLVLVASLLQTSTGYGFSIIGTPFLLLMYPAHTAIQINIILSLCLSTFMMFKIGNEVDKTLFGRLIKGSVIGLVFGLLIYLYLDIRFLKMAVGGLILILTVSLIFKLTIHRTSRGDLAAGGISGLLTTSIGVPGPPLLLYFSGTGTDQVTLRSTTLAFYLVVYFVSLVMQISFGGTSLEAWTSSLIALPSLFIGMLLGQFLFKWISQELFRIITYVILLFTGAYLLVTSF